MAAKASIGDYVRVIRPRGHSLGHDAPIGRVFRVGRSWSDGSGHVWYASARGASLFRGDELEPLKSRPRRGRPSKRAVRNRERLSALTRSNAVYQ